MNREKACLSISISSHIILLVYCIKYIFFRRKGDINQLDQHTKYQIEQLN